MLSTQKKTTKSNSDCLMKAEQMLGLFVCIVHQQNASQVTSLKNEPDHKADSYSELGLITWV